MASKARNLFVNFKKVTIMFDKDQEDRIVKLKAGITKIIGDKLRSDLTEIEKKKVYNMEEELLALISEGAKKILK